MKKILAALGLLAAFTVPALAQSSPGLVYGQVPTAAQWNSYFQAKQDVLGYTPLNQAGGVMQGLLVTVPSTTSQAGLRAPPGVAPTSPVNGDFWSTPTGFYGQVNGATVGPFAATDSASFAATSPLGVSFPAGIVTYALANPVPLSLGGLGGSQAAATVGQLPIFPGAGGAAVPGTNFTAPNYIFSTAATTPLLLGGATANSSLTLRSTSIVSPSGDAMALDASSLFFQSANGVSNRGLWDSVGLKVGGISVITSGDVLAVNGQASVNGPLYVEQPGSLGIYGNLLVMASATTNSTGQAAGINIQLNSSPGAAPGSNNLVALFMDCNTSAVTSPIWCENPVLNVNHLIQGIVTELDLNSTVASGAFGSASQQIGLLINGVQQAGPPAAAIAIQSSGTYLWSNGIIFSGIGGGVSGSCLICTNETFRANNVSYGIDLHTATINSTGLRIGPNTTASLQTAALLGQLANNTVGLTLQRFTDTSPTGYFIKAINAANNSTLFSVGVGGDMVVTGSFTATGLVTNSDLANSATTVNGQTCTLGSTCTVTATAGSALTIGTHLTGSSYNGSAPVTIATDAVSTNTVSTIVARDSSGNFSAGTITASLTGHASLDLAVSALGTGVQTALGVNVGSAGAFVTFNGAGGTPSSITLTNASGLPTTALTGALQAAQFPALTGDITTSAGSLATTLASSISGAKTFSTSITTPTGFLTNIYGGTAAATQLTIGSTNNGSPSGDAMALDASSIYFQSVNAGVNRGLWDSVGLKVGALTVINAGDVLAITGQASFSGSIFTGTSKGVTCSGALTVIASITIKNGLITAATGTGGTCS